MRETLVMEQVMEEDCPKHASKNTRVYTRNLWKRCNKYVEKYLIKNQIEINYRDFILESISSILFSKFSLKETYCREQSIVKKHRKWIY